MVDDRVHLWTIALIILGGLALTYILLKHNPVTIQSPVIGMAKPLPDKIYLKPPEKKQGLLASIDKRVTVTGLTTLDTTSSAGLPWQSCSITNNGPSNVYIALNEWYEPEVPLIADSNVDFDYSDHGGIHKVFLQCRDGGTATVDIYAMRK